MAFLERMIYYLFPELWVAATPWQDIWAKKKREDFAQVAKIVFLVIAVVYIGHYYFFDRVLNLQPEELWFRFRFGMAAVSMACATFYFFPRLHNHAFYKVPLMIGLGLVCYTQAKVSVWHPPASYLFAVAFTYLAAVLLQTSIVKSLVYALLIYSVEFSTFVEAGVSISLLYSTGAVLVAMVTFSRMGYVAEVKYFIANLENLEAQKKIIELNIEVTNQIKAFLPREISHRLGHCMNERRMSVIQATDEILRPRKKEVACIFSDIRGFTQSSKDLDQFVNRGMFPNVKACTEAVDSVGGISRKIGDLLFAYFDKERVDVSVLHAVVAGLEISNINSQFRKLKPDFRIDRFVLISSGEAIVGNLGGFDSSIEITAIGSPVNYLNRVDSLTKDAAFRAEVKNEDIVLDEASANILAKLVTGVEIHALDLGKLNLRIRDFENVSKIYVLPYTDSNRNLIYSLFNYVEDVVKAAA